MNQDVLVAIPTLGRAGRVKTLKNFDPPEGVYLVVDPHEEDLYRNAYPNLNLYVVPERCKIAQKRNYILKFALELNKKYVIQIDDDVERFNNWNGWSGERVSGWEALGEVIRLLKQGFPLASLSYQPYVFKGRVDVVLNQRIWCLLGIDLNVVKKENLFFDENALECEDFDFAAQLILRGYSTAFSFRYNFAPEEWKKNKGGMQTYDRKSLLLQTYNYFLEKYSEYGKVVSLHVKKNKKMEIKFDWKKLTIIGQNRLKMSNNERK